MSSGDWTAAGSSQSLRAGRAAGGGGASDGLRWLTADRQTDRHDHHEPTSSENRSKKHRSAFLLASANVFPDK